MAQMLAQMEQRLYQGKIFSSQFLSATKMSISCYDNNRKYNYSLYYFDFPKILLIYTLISNK